MKCANRELLYEHACDNCPSGRVRGRIRKSEVIIVPGVGHVVMEDVPVGICDRCHACYYHASVLKQAEARAKRRSGRTLKVPVARYVER